MDGYETARLIRERSQSAHTPIIFLTAFGRDDTETLTAYASGAVDFIFAPILANVLRAKVSTFVDLFVQSQELQGSLESITALNAALRESEVRARAVLQNVADGIVTAGEGASSNRSTSRRDGCSATARTRWSASRSSSSSRPAIRRTTSTPRRPAGAC